jgi:hypothetical protein
MLTNDQLRALEERYLPPAEQRCRVCGAPLTFASSGPGGSKYACSSEAASVIKSPFPALEAAGHWRRSEWRDRNIADMAVVAMVREYRDLPGRMDELERDSQRGALEELLAAVESLRGGYVMTRPSTVLEAALGMITSRLSQLGWSPVTEAAGE